VYYDLMKVIMGMKLLLVVGHQNIIVLHSSLKRLRHGTLLMEIASMMIEVRFKNSSGDDVTFIVIAWVGKKAGE